MKLDLIREIWRFVRVRRKWWLLPVMLVLLLMGGLLAFAHTSALGPFIYAIF